MRQILNEKPFEHRCRNGTVFRADRCDFVDGVTVFSPAHLSPAEMMEDAAELGAWHWANIVPHLNGFTGPGKFTVYPRTESEQKRLELVLEMPLMEFFSLDSLREMEVHSITAMRAFNALKIDCEWLADRPEKRISTLGEFMKNYSVCELRRTPNLGARSVDLILRRLENENLQLKYN